MKFVREPIPSFAPGERTNGAGCPPCSPRHFFSSVAPWIALLADRSAAPRTRFPQTRTPPRGGILSTVPPAPDGRKQSHPAGILTAPGAPRGVVALLLRT
jgi:hypothetical protein